jgi:O-antigen/teichoic acid export membrane protein
VSRVLRGSAAGVALQLFHYGSRFAVTPLVLAAVGLEAYGFWALLFQALGLLGLHRIGLLGAAVTFVARLRAEGRPERIRPLLETTSFAMAVLAALVVGLLAGFAPVVVRLLGMPVEGAEAAVTLVRWTATSTALALVLGGYQSALEGFARHDRVRAVEGAASAVELVVLVTLLHAGLGLPALGMAYAVRLLAPVPVYRLLARRELPGLEALPIRCDRTVLRELLGFGGAIQASGLLHLVVATVDRLALAHLVSLHAAGAFELARKLVQLAANLPLQACAPLVPACVSAERRQAELLRSALRWVAVVAVPFLGVLFAVPDVVLTIWVGEVPEGSAVALRLLAAATYVHVCTGPLTARLRARAAGREELAYMLLWSGLALALVPAGASLGGMTGAVTASAAAQVGASLFLLARAPGWIGIGGARLAALIGAPLLCALPAGLWLAETHSEGGTRLALLAELSIRGSLYTAATLVLAWFLALGERERRGTRLLVSRLLGGLRFPRRALRTLEDAP